MTAVPILESPTALIKMFARTEVTRAEIAMFTSMRKGADLRRTNNPIVAQKVKAGSKKVIAELVSIVKPLCIPPPVIVKVKKTPRIAMASTAEASVSGVGFKFIKTRLIDEFAH